MSEPKQRVFYLDCLRAIAAIAVVILHVAATNWYSIDVRSMEWNALNMYDSAVRWAVPIFVMISGALFLSKPTPPRLKDLLCKNVVRLASAFIFWSSIYVAVGMSEGESLSSAVQRFIEGHYHMWFIVMMAAIYATTPVFYAIAHSESALKCFLLAGVILGFMVPRTLGAMEFLDSGYVALLTESLQAVYFDAHFHVAAGYGFYFVLGYYLSQTSLSIWMRRSIYAAGILGFLSTVLFTSLYSLSLGNPSDYFYSNHSVNVLLESVAIFVFAKHVFSNVKNCQHASKVIFCISKNSFGIYLVHALVLERLGVLFGLDGVSIHPLLSVPLLAICVFVLSYGVSVVVRKIPVVGKFIA